MRITFEADGKRLEYNLSDDSTWPDILTDAVLPALRGLTFIIPDSDIFLEAVDEAMDRSEKRSERGDTGTRDE